MTMDIVIKLSELPLKKSGRILRIDESCSCLNRLLDLGICPNKTITPKFKSPFDEPVAYRVNNTLVALRKKDSDKIFVLTREEFDGKD